MLFGGKGWGPLRAGGTACLQERDVAKFEQSLNKLQTLPRDYSLDSTVGGAMLCPAGLSYACFLPCTSCLISGPQRWTWREVVTSVSPPFSMCSHWKSLLFLISTIIVCLIVSWRWMFEPTLLGLLGSKLCLQGQIDGKMDIWMGGTSTPSSTYAKVSSLYLSSQISLTEPGEYEPIARWRQKADSWPAVPSHKKRCHQHPRATAESPGQKEYFASLARTPLKPSSLLCSLGCLAKPRERSTSKRSEERKELKRSVLKCKVFLSQWN